MGGSYPYDFLKCMIYTNLIMASAVMKLATMPLRRSIHTSAAVAKNWKMMDPIEHAYGLERSEAEAIAAGNLDPFNMAPIVRKKNSTKDDPNLVETCEPYRTVACFCEPGSAVEYNIIHEGHPRRCNCGHWFAIKPVPESNPWAA